MEIGANPRLKRGEVYEEGVHEIEANRSSTVIIYILFLLIGRVDGYPPHQRGDMVSNGVLIGIIGQHGDEAVEIVEICGFVEVELRRGRVQGRYQVVAGGGDRIRVVDDIFLGMKQYLIRRRRVHPLYPCKRPFTAHASLSSLHTRVCLFCGRKKITARAYLSFKREYR